MVNTSSPAMEYSNVKEIDATTEVPSDIYMSLLMAAAQADVGQHEIVKGPKGALKLMLSDQDLPDKAPEKAMNKLPDKKAKKLTHGCADGRELCTFLCVPLPCAISSLVYSTLHRRSALDAKN